MTRVDGSVRSVHMRRMMACVACAALFALMAGPASAERQAGKSGFNGVVGSGQPPAQRRIKDHADKPKAAQPTS